MRWDAGRQGWLANYVWPLKFRELCQSDGLRLRSAELDQLAQAVMKCKFQRNINRRQIAWKRDSRDNREPSGYSLYRIETQDAYAATNNVQLSDGIRVGKITHQKVGLSDLSQLAHAVVSTELGARMFNAFFTVSTAPGPLEV